MQSFVLTGRTVAGQVGGSSPDLVSRWLLFNIIHILLDHTRINPKEKMIKIHICCRRTLGQAAHAQSRVSVGAVSRAKSFTGGNKL